MDRRVLGPDDLIAAAARTRETLTPYGDRDWEVRAGELDWTCRETLEHACGLAYAPVLATRGRTIFPLALVVRSGATPAELIGTLETMAVILAEVARAAPPEARAPHPAGLADAEGFVAMEIDELLVHTHDVVSGFGDRVSTDADLVIAVLDRLFPWWPKDEDPWAALLWANGRGSLPDRANPGAEWLWHCAPLHEWDGTVPRWDPVENRPVSDRDVSR